MEFGRAFTFVFDDPEWLKKIGIAGLVFLIPVIGSIVVMGWGLEITRRVIKNETALLPDWINFSEYLPKGFQAFVVGFAYALPLILLIACGQGATIAMTFAAASSNTDAAGPIVTVLSLCISCLFIILGIATGFLMPAALGSLAARGELGDAFKFNEVIGLVRAAPGPYLMVLLGSGLANMILSPLGMVACGIGMLFTVAYTSAVSGHLSGQAYKAAKALHSQTGAM